MSKNSLYIIVALGIILGLLGAGSSVLISYGIFIAAIIGIAIAKKPETAVWILAAYAFVDFGLRSFAGGFASIWDELLLVFMVVLWGWKWLVFRKEDNFKQTPLDMPVLVFIAVMLFMLIFNSSDYGISLEGFRAVVQYILWFFVVVQLLKDEKSAKNICLVLVIITGIMGIHGVYQYIVGVEMPVGWVDQNEAGVRTRVYSILTSPNAMGSLMTLAAPVAVSFAFSEKKIRKKIIFAFLALMMIASLVFTFSRGAWMGFAVAVAIYVLLKDKRLLIPAVIAAIIVVAAVPSVGNRISYMLSSEYIQSSLKGGRLVRWATGIEILKSSPLFGVGLGMFGGAVAINHDLSRLVGIDVIKTFYMDNYYLKTAVESGIIGLIAFIVLMYSVFISSLRTVIITEDKKIKELEIGILSGLSGVMIHNCVENVFEVPLMTSLFWMLAAVMMHLWYINYHKKKTEPDKAV